MFCILILWLASPLRIPGKSRMRKRARTDLCGGRPAMVVPTATVTTASEVKSHSSIDRFLVVFHSPTGMAETGLLACRSEKTGGVSRCSANTKDFLCSGLTMKTSELAGISRDFRGTSSGFLCTPDCVAEKEGFYYRRYLQVPNEHYTSCIIPCV